MKARQYAVEFHQALLDEETRQPYAFFGRIYTMLFATAREAKAYVKSANADPHLTEPFPNVYAVARYVGKFPK